MSDSSILAGEDEDCVCFTVGAGEDDDCVCFSMGVATASLATAFLGGDPGAVTEPVLLSEDGDLLPSLLLESFLSFFRIFFIKDVMVLVRLVGCSGLVV